MMLPEPHGPCQKLAALNISIGNSWTDEQLVRFLAERKAEDPLPVDVLAGVDCSGHDPQFTGSLWCLKWLDDQEPYGSAENGIRKTNNGFWKPVDSSRISTSTAIVGVKIILEFHEGYAPCGKKTGWMMHEYQVQQNDEANLPQAYKSLCNVFLQSDKNAERQSFLNANAPNSSFEAYLQYLANIEEPEHTISANEQDTFSRTGEHEQNTESASDDTDAHDVVTVGDYMQMNDLISSCKEQHEQKSQSAGDDIAIYDNIATDDYIELNDLLNSEASSSTSVNTSKRSMISEEYFDSDAFLKEILENCDTPDGQHKDHEFSITAPTKSANVVINPTEEGLLHIHGVNALAAGPSQQIRVSEGDTEQHSSKEHPQHSSSVSSCFPSSRVKRSHSDSESSTKSQGVRPTSKFGKIGKYFCFGSF